MAYDNFQTFLSDLDDDEVLQELEQEIQELKENNTKLESEVAAYRSEVSARELEVIEITTENEASEKRVQVIDLQLTSLQDQLIEAIELLLVKNPGVFPLENLTRDSIYEVVAKLKGLSEEKENSHFAAAFRSAMAPIKVN